MLPMNGLIYTDRHQHVCDVAGDIVPISYYRCQVIKVMFLHLCVSLFTRGDSCPTQPDADLPPSDTTGYGQQADSMHPTGIHSS